MRMQLDVRHPAASLCERMFAREASVSSPIPPPPTPAILPSGGVMTRRRLLLLGVAVLLCAAALLAIGILLVGHFGATERRVVATTLLLAGYGVLSLPGVVLLDQGRRRLPAEGAIALAAIAAALALVSVWGFSDSDAVGRSVGTATILAVAAAQAAALLARQTERDPPMVRRLFAGSCVTATLAAGFAIAVLWTQASGGLYARLIGALVVLDLLLVALQPLTATIASGPPRIGPKHRPG